jgi:hypothetical protein
VCPQLVQLHPGGEGAPPHLRGGQPGDGEPLGAGHLHRDAGPGQQLAQPAGVRAADEHGARAVGVRAVAQLRQRSLPHQSPGADDDRPVGGLLDLGQQVAADQDRASLLVREVAEEPAQPLDALGVQAVGRLVEDQHPRVAQQRRRQPQPLAHAQRVAAGLPAAGRAEADLLQHLVGAAQREPGGAAVDAQVVAAAAGRVERRLQHRAHPAQWIGQVGVPDAVERGGADVRRDEAERHPQGGGLPRAVGPEEAGHLPGLDGEAQVVDRTHRAEGLAEAAHLDPYGFPDGQAGAADRTSPPVRRSSGHPSAPRPGGGRGA